MCGPPLVHGKLCGMSKWVGFCSEGLTVKWKEVSYSELVPAGETSRCTLLRGFCVR